MRPKCAHFSLKSLRALPFKKWMGFGASAPEAITPFSTNTHPMGLTGRPVLTAIG